MENVKVRLLLSLTILIGAMSIFAQAAYSNTLSQIVTAVSSTKNVNKQLNSSQIRSDDSIRTDFDAKFAFSLADSDSDGVNDDVDNCPTRFNPGQQDGDGDGVGDVCDNCPLDALNDIDADGVCGNVDNCPFNSDASQADHDFDGLGDACDNCDFDANTDQADSDNDGDGDICDNCPTVPNTNQADSDGDGVGDDCDNCPGLENADQADRDGDGVGDVCDNCLTVPNADQDDLDGDNIGTLCDNCPEFQNPSQEEFDGDHIGDACDNCPTVPNLSQTNSDADFIGDACDNCPLIANFPQTDGDGNGVGDECEGSAALTPIGTGVEVNPAPGVNITFSDVSLPGVTEVQQSNTGDQPPASFAVFPVSSPVWYEIETGAFFEGEITLCFNYDPALLTGPEGALQLMHFDGANWQDITTFRDLQADIICGTVSSLSPFIIAEPIGDPIACCTHRGDVDHNGRINIADCVRLIIYIFDGAPAPPCLDEAEVNGASPLDVSDVVYLLNFLFKVGPAPAPCE